MPLNPESPLAQLMGRFSKPGRVRWIGLRPSRDEAMLAVDSVLAEVGSGLVGDRYKSESGKRAVTLIQAEHLPAIAALAGHDSVSPATLRRNVVIEGLPLAALSGKRFRLGEALLEYTGPCDPCSRMETALGHGGYNAMRDMGGITARVLEPGGFSVGDALAPVDAEVGSEPVTR